MTPTPHGLNERQRHVVATMRMRLSRAEALAYLAGEGYRMSESTYGRIKSWLKRTELQRLHKIAQYDFSQQHMARIDICEHIEELMWKEFFQEKNHYKRVMILKEIKELQPYISTYYDTTRAVIEKAYGSGQTDNRISEHPVRSE